MNPKELRIGNFFAIDGEEREIYSLLSLSFTSVLMQTWLKREDGSFVATIIKGSTTVEAITPIALTEEWLARFGFILSEDELEEGEVREPWQTMYTYTLKGFNLLYDSKDDRVFAWDATKVRLPYVHTLQNLYYLSTGEELEIK